MASFLSEKAILGTTSYGKGLFARYPIFYGEIVIDFTDGTGSIVSREYAMQMFDQGWDYDIQIDDDAFFVPLNDLAREDADFLNHSCRPNLGIRGSLVFIAMRDIEQEEHLTFDYAMSESFPYSMKCLCGSDTCRGTITGDDWKLPALQKTYQGYFSTYIQKKIDAL